MNFIDHGGGARNPSRATCPPVWVLVSVTFSGTLGMHLFVPALPDAARSLGTSATHIQLTISLYIWGLALGQLVYGPLADGYGRRPTLLAGLGLYTAAGMFAAVAPTSGLLIGARLLQALGGCAAILLTRAIVRDACSNEEAVSRLALISVMALMGPGLAPLLGAALVDTWGWRSLFVFLAGLGVLNLCLAWHQIPETGKPSGRPSVRTVRRDYGRLVGSPRFLCYAVGGGFATTSFYGFIAAAPFILSSQMGRPLHEVGVYLFVMMAAIALGNFVVNRLAGRVAVDTFMYAAIALSSVCAAVLLFLALNHHLDALLTGILMTVYCIGVGACSPAVAIKALSVDRRVVGSAAGLAGSAQMSVGALCTMLSSTGKDPAISAFSVLFGGGLVALTSLWLASLLDRRAPAGADSLC